MGEGGKVTVGGQTKPFGSVQMNSTEPAGAAVAGAVVARGAPAGAVVLGGVVPEDVRGTLTGPAGSITRVGVLTVPKVSWLLALPVAVCTVTVPFVEPTGTVAVSCVAEPA